MSFNREDQPYKLRIIIISMVVGALIVVGLWRIASARADTYDVCEYLDARPTVAGVEDLIAMGITGNHWSAEHSGKFVADQIVDYCPRHTIELKAFINKWVPKGTVA